MSRKIQTIDTYKQISGDVWNVFKKYFPADADTSDFTDEVHKLDQKYKEDVRQYCFARALMKVYFDELNELKGVRERERAD